MLVLVLLTGCFKNEYALLERYKEHMAKAKAAALANDSENERIHYSKALAAAKEMEWPEGTANVLIATAQSFSGSKEFTNAENALREAQSVCSGNRCEESTVWSIYDNLFILYTIVMKDLSKADALIREMELSGDRSNDQKEFDRKLSSLKNELDKKRKDN
jgi:hypothetical protein